ncbi:MAG: hypothetical protein JW891_08290 [Candidatus Lokiarchaeota archaeon]|nr:hypothetical protein [Candidatus Lokiarchaeota archaeon]
MTTYWAPLLHIYQPPTQEIDILRKINKECYVPLFSVIEKNDNSKFCLNINGVLMELLKEYGMDDTLDLLDQLVVAGKVEILGTGKFHPILPLIPKEEASRQIRMNEESNRNEFGASWMPRGFFPPEMAISTETINLIGNLGYKWVIMSGIACPTEEKGIEWPYNKIYSAPNGMLLYFRDDILSNKIAFQKIGAKEFVQALGEIYPVKDKTKNDKDKYIITAMDGETFGHHIPNYEKVFLAKTLDLVNKESDIETIFISDLSQKFPIDKKKILPRNSSWSTNYEDLKASVPYPLWKHPDNNVHKYYWKILKSLNRLLKMASKIDHSSNWDIENYYNTARWFYDRGIHSCPPWWANFDRGMWSPNLIYKGVELLIRSSLNAQLALVHAKNEEGEGYFDSISYYHGLLLMELYNTTKHNLKKL